MTKYQKRYAALAVVTVFLIIFCIVVAPTPEPKEAPGPILAALRAIDDGGRWTNDSEQARAALLQRIKPGTDIPRAVGALSAEGFGCDDASEISTTANCQFLSVEGWTIKRWIVDLQFDETHRLVDAKVGVWRIGSPRG